MCDWQRRISVETVLAQLTVASVGVVATVDAPRSASVTRQFVQLQVESTPAGMLVTNAGCKNTSTHTHIRTHTYTDAHTYIHRKDKHSDAYTCGTLRKVSKYAGD